MAYEVRKTYRPSYTTRPRIERPRLFLIHATRGHTSLNLQDDATLNWFRNAPDRGGWGSTADVLISADDDIIWEFGDIMHERSAWSAGYGSLGSRYEWGADEWAVSIELAQTASQEPFSEHVLDKLVWYVRQRSRDFGLDIPAVHVAHWTQRRSDPVPAGWIGHDETANGRKSGKSDPGEQFPWDDVLARVRRGMVSGSTRKWSVRDVVMMAYDLLAPSLLRRKVTRILGPGEEPRDDEDVIVIAVRDLDRR